MSNTTPQATAPSPSPAGLDIVPASGWTAADRAAFAALRAEERAAAYLNSIRRMMLFFVILTVLVLIGVVAVGLLEWSAINSLKPSNSLGLPGQ